MAIEAVVEQMRAQAANAAPLGGTLKFMLDDHPVYIDGTGETNEVSTEDKDADCVLITSVETLQKVRSGDLNAMMAVMGGKIKIKGDMGLAMKLQNLLG